jgi:hypothetical protein
VPGGVTFENRILGIARRQHLSVQGSKRKAKPIGTAKLGQMQKTTLPINTKFSAELRSGLAQARPQSAAAEPSKSRCVDAAEDQLPAGGVRLSASGALRFVVLALWRRKGL